MAYLPLLEEFQAELKRKKLPRRYILRAAHELHDHIEDIQDEPSGDLSSDCEQKLKDRIGSPEELATIAAEQWRHTILGRFPLVSFILAPVPFAYVAFHIFFFGILFLQGKFCGLLGISSWNASGDAISEWYLSYNKGFEMVLGIVPCSVTAWLVCRIVRRSERSYWWIFFSCNILAVVAFRFFVFIGIESTSGRFALFFGWTYMGLVRQFVQCLVPLAIGGIFIWRSCKKNASRNELISG